MKQFCAGVGTNFPDLTNASRPITRGELEECHRNGVTGVIEIKIGYDGLVMASSFSEPAMSLTLEHVYLALAAYVPDASGTGLIANPYRTWQEIDPALPNRQIEVLGPPPTSGTRDSFLELVMEPGADRIPFLNGLKTASNEDLLPLLQAAGLTEFASALQSGAMTPATLFRAISHTLREDGVYVDSGENDNLIVQRLGTNPRAVGIFGFSYLDENTDVIQGYAIDGVTPDFETISDQSYGVARPLLLYAKAQHVAVIPGMREFLQELTSERAWGDTGYLTDRGLIPMLRDERQEVAESVANLVVLEL